MLDTETPESQDSEKEDPSPPATVTAVPQLSNGKNGFLVLNTAEEIVNLRYSINATGVNYHFDGFDF